jgi:hypothetical protein
MTSEKALQAQVLDLAHRLGWRTAHISSSIRQVRRADGYHFIGDAACAGFPDLVLVRRGRLLFIELKAPKGKLTELQSEWLDDLAKVANATAGQVEVHVWRPADLEAIARVLK